MRWYERVIAAHLAVTESVSHYERMKSSRYFVWQEDGANDLTADDMHEEKAVTGTTDLFTKQEFDSWAEEIGFAFDAYGIAWALNSVQYEEDTGVIHHEWTWEVFDGED